MVEGCVVSLWKLTKRQQIWLKKRITGSPHNRYTYYFSNSRKVRKLLKKVKALL